MWWLGRQTFSIKWSWVWLMASSLSGNITGHTLQLGRSPYRRTSHASRTQWPIHLRAQSVHWLRLEDEPLPLRTILSQSWIKTCGAVHCRLVEWRLRWLIHGQCWRCHWVETSSLDPTLEWFHLNSSRRSVKPSSDLSLTTRRNHVSLCDYLLKFYRPLVGLFLQGAEVWLRLCGYLGAY